MRLVAPVCGAIAVLAFKLACLLLQIMRSAFEAHLVRKAERGARGAEERARENR
jgi:hypothetical protein